MSWTSFPRDLADRCVKCAQCLPVCPTWQLSRDESESPRGRLTIMMALADGALAPKDATLAHLERCLGCRQCEAACPAEVPYGRLADAAQAVLGRRRRDPWTARLLRALIGRPSLFRWLTALLAWRIPAAGRYAPTASPGRGEVYLFLGCVARVIDGATLRAAFKALRGAGYTVVIPGSQACCGAMHLHAGEHATATRLAEQNAAAFNTGAPVVSCASGCAATLCEDPAFGAQVIDISTLLAGVVAPRTAGADTVLHTPCTLASVQRAGEAPARLLEGTRRLPERGRCCGAAGDYLLRQPEIAARLRDEVLDDIGDAQVVFTSNPGCAYHLRRGLAARGSTAAVRHPVLEWLGNDR